MHNDSAKTSLFTDRMSYEGALRMGVIVTMPYWKQGRHGQIVCECISYLTRPMKSENFEHTYLKKYYRTKMCMIFEFY